MLDKKSKWMYTYVNTLCCGRQQSAQTKKPMTQVISQTYVIGRRGGNKDKKASKALIKNLTAI